MPFNQSLTGLIEPNDPAFRNASSADLKWFYDEAGKAMLARHRTQMLRGVGANGRAFPRRKQVVLPDGSDGPCMSPHYDMSRTITMADYMATAHSLTLFFHAGVGRREHRAAREKAARSFSGKGKNSKHKSKGEKAANFGQILEWHSRGEVKGAPVRDVRLSAASIREVKKVMARKWADRVKARRKAKAKPPPPRPQPQPQPTPAPPPWRRLPAAAKGTTPQRRPQPRHAVPLPNFGRQANSEV